MPTNVSPGYKEAQQAFRKAGEPRERLNCLKEMLRTIPKHKGTENLQADIKSRIKQLTEELAGPKKGGAHTGPAYTIRPEGAAQVALIGPLNAGKSSLHSRLTGSHSEVGPYVYTTRLPIPGMLPFEDIHFQLIDLPPISADFMEPWFVNALQPADAALLVIDLSDAACMDHILSIRERLAEKKIILREDWPGFASEDDGQSQAHGDSNEIDDPFGLALPTLLVANKSDLDPDPDEVNVLEELLGVRFPAVATSATTGRGLDQIGQMLFEGLQVVRVYTKVPGKSADTNKPFTVFCGGTVLDVARLVHKDIARTFKFARIWGNVQFDGQQVGADHHVCDKDVLELHAQ